MEGVEWKGEKIRKEFSSKAVGTFSCSGPASFTLFLATVFMVFVNIKPQEIIYSTGSCKLLHGRKIQ